MNKITLIIASFMFVCVTVFGLSTKTATAAPTANPTSCGENGFLGLPYWYKYLDPVEELEPDPLTGENVCRAKLKGIKDIWLVVAACVELLIRLASMIAIGFMIYGGVSYVISQGAPDKTKKAQATVINAVIGLAISVVAAAVVSFIAGRF
jgi:hypothetical protein